MEPDVVAFANVGDAADVIDRASTRRTAVGNDHEWKMPRFTILLNLLF